MKVSIVVLAVCAMLIVNVAASPLGNHWYPTDPRCSGSAASGYRLKRSAGSNRSPSQTGNYWMYNGNLGSCESHYGSHDNTGFESKDECDRACLNIYHFS